MTIQTPEVAPAGRAPRPPARTGRRALLGGAAVLLVAAPVALLISPGDDDPAPSAATAPAVTTPAVTTPAVTTPADAGIPAPPPTPEPTGPTEDVDELPEALPEVALDEPAAVGNGIVARIAGLEAIDGTAVGPGNVAGPALRITVRIANGTPEPVSLGGVAVNAAHGPARTPASPLGDPSQRPFTGMLQPGKSADGVYVFSVPPDDRDRVTVEVGYQAGAPLLMFTGTAP